jgi:hypothetical protein
VLESRFIGPCQMIFEKIFRFQGVPKEEEEEI